MDNMARFFIAVPHQMPAQEWFICSEPLEEHDQFIEWAYDYAKQIVEGGDD